jgi:hypothetical protein
MNRFNDPPFVIKWLCALGALVMLVLCVLNVFAAISSQMTGRAMHGQEIRRIITPKQEVTKEQEPQKFNRALSKNWYYAFWTGILLVVFFYFFRKIE